MVNQFASEGICSKILGMLAVADCNNFFASCERSIDPGLDGVPIVVLSNNDGVVIARSNEAKALGIKMGAPYFQVRELCKAEGVRVFSGNFELYTQRSAEVMQVLAANTPAMEVYSVDEAFMDITPLVGRMDLEEWGRRLRDAVRIATNIPLSIGIAPTKVLCKIANHKAKISGGVCLLDSEEKVSSLLKDLPVDEVWGVGRALATRFIKSGVHSAWQLREAPSSFIRKLSSVNGERVQMELKGVVCFPLNTAADPAKSIQVSRSFGTAVTELPTLQEAVATFMEAAARKLRAQGQVAGVIGVYIRTNPRAKTPQHRAYEEQRLAISSSDTEKLLAVANKLTVKLYKPGFPYRKAGVVLMSLSSGREVAMDLFEKPDSPKRKRLMDVYDALHGKFGKRVFWGAMGVKGEWQGLSEHKHKAIILQQTHSLRLSELADGLSGPRIKFLD